MPQYAMADSSDQGVAVGLHTINGERLDQPRILRLNDEDSDRLTPAVRAVLTDKNHPLRLLPFYPDGKQLVEKLRGVIHTYFASAERNFPRQLTVAPCMRSYVPWDECAKGQTEIRKPHSTFTLPGSSRFIDDDIKLIAAGLYDDFMRDVPKDKDCFVEISIDPETGVLYSNNATLLVFNIITRFTRNGVVPTDHSDNTPMRTED